MKIYGNGGNVHGTPEDMISQLNWLKLSLQKSIEREEQIETELQAEKARADTLVGALEGVIEIADLTLGYTDGYGLKERLSDVLLMARGGLVKAAEIDKALAKVKE